MTTKPLLKFRRPNIVPPGGYKFLDPNKGEVFEGGTLLDLVSLIVKYRTGNKFVIEENIVEIVEDWICHQIPESFTSAYNPNTDPIVTNSGSATVAGATRFMLGRFRANGRKKVSEELGASRADTCRACENNADNVACLSCQGLNHWVRGWVKGPEKNEDGLRVCKACAIMNIAQIYAPVEVFKPMMNKNMIESHGENCWKVKELSDGS